MDELHQLIVALRQTLIRCCNSVYRSEALLASMDVRQRRLVVSCLRGYQQEIERGIQEIEKLIER